MKTKNFLFIIIFSSIFFLCIFISDVSAKECKKSNKSFAVVELFTSEGCSDCPDADKVLNEISKFDPSKNVFALAFHVTYWDYIGWEDSFGKQEFTDRQGKYSKIFRERNYTPQAIVNGRIDIVGSKRSSIHSSINSELSNESSDEIELSVTRKKNILEVKYKVKCAHPNQVLNFALVEKGLVSKVTRGENRGSTLTHENVVRSFQTLALSKVSGSIKLEYSGIENNPKNFELISYLQDNLTFAITGAERNKIE